MYSLFLKKNHLISYIFCTVALNTLNISVPCLTTNYLPMISTNEGIAQ